MTIVSLRVTVFYKQLGVVMTRTRMGNRRSKVPKVI